MKDKDKAKKRDQLVELFRVARTNSRGKKTRTGESDLLGLANRVLKRRRRNEIARKSRKAHRS